MVDHSVFRTAVALAGFALAFFAPVPTSRAGTATQDTCLALAAALQLDPATCEMSAPASEPVRAVAKPIEPEVKRPEPHAELISNPADRDYRIYFPQGSVTLVEEYRQHLDLLAGVLRTQALQGTCLKLVGHSDSQGSFQANYELSLDRAQTVQKYLLERIHGANIRIQIDGKGEEEPLSGVAPNDPLNRRVEIFARRCL
ncbi:MAG: OmpA family protein [Brevirhabdus sp.]